MTDRVMKDLQYLDSLFLVDLSSNNVDSISLNLIASGFAP